ncbi:pyroglutamyl-peptidase I [Microbacterium imperiale]|uniref:pyroglutamyl-peptidase I n=1 Tax=Microbacterium imperiale TaxID=33884 RepID=UPI001AE95E15|nr:pyroglutamyl-peptidase I [Microbacterium imperiale]MBP2421931.1 pyroglutamyl-peptidase [Microbacterium imperiale]MDS0198969.1 pyroglutamyl-peptidase I [Microbacterium imperiale]
MRTVLLTGFEPFAGDATNPSGDAVRLVAAEWNDPERLVVEVLPVEFDRAGRTLTELIATHRPEVVVATGLAGGRSGITPERVAINLMDARIPDNAGAQPVDVPSRPNGPAAHFATIPVKAITAAIVEAGVPASVSHSAGTFVCNHAMYTALDSTDRESRRAGFIHVPHASENAPEGQPSLPLADIARGLRIAIRTSLDAETDATYAAGTIS